MIHGDGDPLLFFYEDEESRFCYVVMKQDIADCSAFQGKLERGAFYDLETPYGYGGPLTDKEIVERSQRSFAEQLTKYCIENHIVSQFVRFHPLLNNQTALEHVIETRYLRDTIYIDTTSSEAIMANMDSKNRNMVRKAIKNGVTVERKPVEDYRELVSMYVETMAKNNADEYYTFQEEYFASLKNMSENACIFYAVFEGKPIGGAIMFYNERYMHYHLAGTHTQYRQYSPNNLMLYEAACWASERGIKKFHLGGGMAPNDSLFGFKKQFNKNGYALFTVGRTIFDREKYDYLRRIRKELDETFDENNGFMIQYRR